MRDSVSDIYINGKSYGIIEDNCIPIYALLVQYFESVT